MPTTTAALFADFKGKFGGCLTVCCEMRSVEPTLRLINEDRRNQVFASFGLHPHDSKHWNNEVEQKFRQIFATNPKAVAWGECGTLWGVCVLCSLVCVMS